MSKILVLQHILVRSLEGDKFALPTTAKDRLSKYLAQDKILKKAFWLKKGYFPKKKMEGGSWLCFDSKIQLFLQKVLVIF